MLRFMFRRPTALYSCVLIPLGFLLFLPTLVGEESRGPFTVFSLFFMAGLLFASTTESYYQSESRALRTLPFSASRVGAALWVQSVLFAPAYLLIVHMALRPWISVITPFETAILAQACCVGLVTSSTSNVALAAEGKVRRAIPRPGLLAAFGLLVLAGMVVWDKSSPYWLVPPVIALMAYTWLKRETLAQVKPRAEVTLAQVRDRQPVPAVSGSPGERVRKAWWLRGARSETIWSVCLVAVLVCALETEVLSKVMDVGPPPTREAALIRGAVPTLLFPLSAVILTILLAREGSRLKAMRLVPASSRQVFAYVVTRYYAEAASMAVAAGCVPLVVRRALAWTPAAAVLAGAGFGLLVALALLKDPRRSNLALVAVVSVFIALDAVLMGVGLTHVPVQELPVVVFSVFAITALVLNPLALVLLYRRLDRDPGAYRALNILANLGAQDGFGGRP